jgi:hypothetical protein
MFSLGILLEMTQEQKSSEDALGGEAQIELRGDHEPPRLLIYQP